jgi:carbon-monoxide dehydrogenase large subunit
VSILGNRVVRVEDPRLLTDGGTYVDDLPLEGALHAVYVRSTMAHARIAGVDTAAARSASGVVDVVTAADLDLGAFPRDSPMTPEAMAQPWLAGDAVRFVGEPVAVVLAESRAAGVDAVELVEVDYEPLPAVVDVDVALRGDALLHPAAGTNVALAFEEDPDPSLFDGCDVVVRHKLVNQRVAPCPLEVRAAAAAWGVDGRLTHFASSQGSHGVRETLRRALGLERAQVRVITPDVGGGFGAKGCSYPEELLLGWLARRAGRPVRWVETRSESMVALGHGRGQVQHVEIGGRRDGTIEAYRLTVVQDAGAYARMGAVLPFMTRTMLTGVYRIPRAQFSSRSVVTNTTPTVAYRGAGRPEATAAIERAVDLFATEIGVDPAEVRRRNLVARDAFPFSTPTGATYDVGDYEGALDRALDAAGYTELLAEQARRRAAGDRLAMGIGLSTYVEITNPMGQGEFGAVTIGHDGSAVVRTGVAPHGQGHATALAMVASDRLGIPLERITVVHGDTDVVPRGRGTGGSRSLQAGGTAVLSAADAVVEQARAVAAELLEANADDVVLDVGEGRFHVAGTPAVSRSWTEVAAAAPGALAAELETDNPGPTFPFGAHVAVVDVDLETGVVRLRRLVAVDDAGTVINPLLVEGQVHGGLAQGVAQALFEEVLYDGEGNPLTTSFADYSFPSAAELPSFDVVPMATPTPVNPLGAKGIGESGTIGSTAAVQNAVVDALAHLGVRHLDMPATPERVWRAISAASH